MNIRPLVCFGLLAICVSPILCDILGLGDVLFPVANLLGLGGIVEPVTNIIDVLFIVPIYLIRKWVTFFIFADYNQDGKLEQTDFALAVDTVIANNPKMDPARAEELRNIYVPKAWVAFIRMFPTARPGPLTLVDVIIEIVNTPNILLNAHALIDGIFQICDVDGDGLIDKEEHKVLYVARGLANAVNDSAISFAESDANGDGVLTEGELGTCAMDFFIGPLESANRCKYFVGPLMSKTEAVLELL